jgi:hypothetical protein
MNFFFKNHPEPNNWEDFRDKSLDELGLPQADDPWSGWASLLQRPWFSRVWIVQEFLNAKESVFMSGAVEIRREVLVHCAHATGVCSAIREIVTKYSREPRAALTLIDRALAVSIYQVPPEKHPDGGTRIFGLWTRSRLLEATDPRDRVFALLSTQKAVPLDIVDYTKDVVEVYTQIAKIALTLPIRKTKEDPTVQSTLNPWPLGGESQITSRFLACKTRSSHGSNLPSWVPDWRPSDVKFVALTRFYVGTTLFEAPYQHAVFENKVCPGCNVL